MVQIIAFQPRHLARLEVQPEQLKDFKYAKDKFGTLEDYARFIMQHTELLEDSVPAIWTIYDEINDSVVGCGGICRLSAQTCEAWMYLSKSIVNHKLFFFTEIRKIMDRLRVNRLQALVDSDFLRGQRFVEKLGFIKEGVLHKYGIQNNDQIMYYAPFIRESKV